MNDTKLTLKNVRLSYANIWEPKETPNGDLKYGASLIIPKTDKKQIAEIKRAIEAAKNIGKSKVVNKNGKIPPNLKVPLRDGDTDRFDDDAYEGCYFINANSNTAPKIVDRKIKPILDRSAVYSGCYANVAVTFYAYKTDAGSGIAAGLGNIQKVKDGEPLGGASNPEDDFEVLDDDEFETEFANTDDEDENMFE